MDNQRHNPRHGGFAMGRLSASRPARFLTLAVTYLVTPGLVPALWPRPLQGDSLQGDPLTGGRRG